jgi:hypothetical protein
MSTRLFVLSLILVSGIATAHALNLKAARSSGSDLLKLHMYGGEDGGGGDGQCYEAPEPGSLPLLAAGLIGAVGVIRLVKAR